MTLTNPDPRPETTSTTAPDIPPRHPDSGTLVQPSVGGNVPTDTTPVHSNTASTATGAGAGLGSKIGGFFKTAHGAGETTRGTINSALDSIGDAIAGRESGTTVNRSQKGEANESVAQRGMAEVKEGYAALQGGGATGHSGATGTGARTT